MRLGGLRRVAPLAITCAVKRTWMGLVRGRIYHATVAHESLTLGPYTDADGVQGFAIFGYGPQPDRAEHFTSPWAAVQRFVELVWETP